MVTTDPYDEGVEEARQDFTANDFRVTRALDSLLISAKAIKDAILRLVAELEVTETFKPKKQGLMDEGYDPSRTRDPLYVDDRTAGAYAPLDAARFDAIQAGRTRL